MSRCDGTPRGGVGGYRAGGRDAVGSQSAEEWRVEVSGEGEAAFEACMPFAGGFVLAGGVGDDSVLDGYVTQRTDHVVELGDGSYGVVSESSHEADSWLSFARFEPGDRGVRPNHLGGNDGVFQSVLAVRAASDDGVHALVGVDDWVVEYWRLGPDGERERAETFDLPGDEDDRGPVATATTDGFDVVTVGESAGSVRVLRLDAGDGTATGFSFGVGDGEAPFPIDVATAPDGSVGVVGTIGGGADPIAGVALRTDGGQALDWRWQYKREHPPDEPTPTAALNEPIVRPQAATFGTGSLVVAGVTRPWRLEPGDAWAVGLSPPGDAESRFGVTETVPGDLETTAPATPVESDSSPSPSETGTSSVTDARGDALSPFATACVTVATLVGHRLASAWRETDATPNRSDPESE